MEGSVFKWLARSKLAIVQIVQRLAKPVLFSFHIEARPLVFEVLSVADDVRVVPGAATASLHPIKCTDFTVVVLGGPATAPGLDRLGDGRHLVLLGAVGVLPVCVSVRDEGRAYYHLRVVLVLVA